MKKLAIALALCMVLSIVVSGVVFAVKPGPVTVIGKGQVNDMNYGATWGGPGDVSATGHWKVVVNLKTCHISFSAVVKDPNGVVYKVSAVGVLAATDVSLVGTRLELTNATVTVTSQGTSNSFAGSEIVVDDGADLEVDLLDSRTINFTGDVTKFQTNPH